MNFNGVILRLFGDCQLILADAIGIGVGMTKDFKGVCVPLLYILIGEDEVR